MIIKHVSAPLVPSTVAPTLYIKVCVWNSYQSVSLVSFSLGFDHFSF